MAVIGGFRSDLSMTCMIDGNFGNVSAVVFFSKVAYQVGGGGGETERRQPGRIGGGRGTGGGREKGGKRVFKDGGMRELNAKRYSFSFSMH